MHHWALLGRRNPYRISAIGLTVALLTAAIFALLPLHTARIEIKLPVDGYALSLAWSEDSRLLAVSTENFTRITIWDVATKTPAHELRRGVAFGHSLAFVQNDKYLLMPSAADQTENDRVTAVSLWDVAQGQVSQNVRGPYPLAEVNENTAEQFSVDEKRNVLAVLFHGRLPLSVGVYNMADWTLTYTLQPVAMSGKPGVGIPASLAVSPDGQYLATGTFTGAIAIYRVATGQLIKQIDAYAGSSSEVGDLAFSYDSKLLLSAAGTNGALLSDALKIWQVPDGTLAASLPLTIGGKSGNKVRGIAWSPDGRYVASASDDHFVRLWDIAKPAQPSIVTEYPRTAWNVAFSPDGKRLAASGYGYVVIAELNQ